MTLVVKKPPTNAGDVRDAGSIRGSGIFPGERHGKPFLVLLPGESLGQKSLVGYSPQDHKDSDTTQVTKHKGVE